MMITGNDFIYIRTSDITVGNTIVRDIIRNDLERGDTRDSLVEPVLHAMNEFFARANYDMSHIVKYEGIYMIADKHVVHIVDHPEDATSLFNNDLNYEHSILKDVLDVLDISLTPTQYRMAVAKDGFEPSVQLVIDNMLELTTNLFDYLQTHPLERP